MPSPRVTPLIDAAQAGDHAAVQQLLATGESIDQRDVFGKTALIHAAGRGDLALVTLLLERGANANAAQFPTNHGTALEYAIGGRHREVIDLLLARGVTPTGFDLNHAATQGECAIVDRLLDHGAPLTTSPHGTAALLALCGFGPRHVRPPPPDAHVRTVARLIAAGADVNAADAQGNPPLLAAVSLDNGPIVDLLLQHGASAAGPDGARQPLVVAHTAAMTTRLLQAPIPEAVRRAAFWWRVHFGRRDLARLIAQTLPESGALLAGLGLLEAVTRGDLESVRRLAASQAGAPAWKEFGGCALHDALGFHRRPEREAMTEALLQAGVDPNVVVGSATPLISAVARDDLALTRRLLRAGAQPDFRTKEGDTALMVAHGSDELGNDRLVPAGKFVPVVDEMAQTLLDAGADVNARNGPGRTALSCAVERYPHNLERLLQAGADVNLATSEGFTALMYAGAGVTGLLLRAGADPNARALNGQTPLHLCLSPAKAGLLLNHGANPEARDADGRTPLMVQAFMGRMDMVKWLVPLTKDLNATDGHGGTAVLGAAATGHERIVVHLAKLGASLSGQDRFGRTALIHAGNGGDITIARLALSAGVAVNHRDHEGRTALLAAAAFGHAELVRLLLARGADTSLADRHGRTPLDWTLLSNRPELEKLLRAR